MPGVANRLRRIRQNLPQHVKEGLDSVANDAERIAKFTANAHWEDDTGSAVGSITGYHPDINDHTKNFDDPNWSAARSGRRVSFYGNTPDNYFPETFQMSADEYESFLTMFVGYGPDIQSISSDAGVMLFMEVMDMMPTVFAARIARAFQKGFRS